MMTKEPSLCHCGLVGRKLGHSYSPQIHGMLGDYEYRLFEKEPDELELFLHTGNWKGLNVTIPYKKDVFRYCDRLSEAARVIGSVNTLVRMADGGIYGDNTDAYGFDCLLEHNGIHPMGKKALILGNGGACAAVRYILEKRGARVVVISRKGPDNYDNLERHRDAALIVNATPLGMFPENGRKAVDLAVFPEAEAVLDLIYNPARTALMLQAERMGIQTDNGLFMLVAQAYASSVQFLDPSAGRERDARDHASSVQFLDPPAGRERGARDHASSVQFLDPPAGRERNMGSSADLAGKLHGCEPIVEKIYHQLSFEMQNIILIGMPGCGKTEVAKRLGRLTDREVLDLDEIFENTFSITPAQCILQKGEAVFRKMESDVIEETGKLSGKIIPTGGGCVTIPGNYPLLHQNGVIVWIRRDLDLLAQDGRPLSLENGVEALYQKRKPLYEAFADVAVDNDGTPEETARKILQACSMSVDAGR